MVLISETFEIVTPESADHGDVADRGFNFEDESYSFRDLVSLLRDYRGGSASCYPLTVHNAFQAWITSGEDHNYRTGETETTSLHYSRNNKPRNVKYWVKALQASGFLNA